MAPDRKRMANERRFLRRHAGEIQDQVQVWDSSAYRIKEAECPAVAFTEAGREFAASYEAFVNDYAWYAWRIGVTLNNLSNAVDRVADNYGKVEEKIENDVSAVGEQF